MGKDSLKTIAIVFKESFAQEVSEGDVPPEKLLFFFFLLTFETGIVQFGEYFWVQI